MRIRCVMWLAVLAGCEGTVVDTSAPERLATTEGEVVAPTTIAGKTEHTASVTSLGSATVRVPVWLPPSAGLAEVPLALVYDNRQSNSVLGVGWRLDGPKMIRRCQRTVAADGSAGPIEFTNADRFCVDGQQLKLKSGTAGLPGAEYGAELESFSRFTIASSASGGGPGSFVETTRNGLRLTYGGNGGAGNESVKSAWRLSSVRDPAGNEVRLFWGFVSDGPAHLPRLARIEYPYSASGGPAIVVRFNYLARPDVLRGYTAGREFVEDKLMSSIVVETPAGVLIRRLAFTYEQAATARSRLIAMQECVPEGCQAPTTYRYQDAPGGVEAVPIHSAGLASADRRHSVDLDGDGRTDLLWAKGQFAADNKHVLLQWNLRLATETGFGPDRPLPLKGFFDSDGVFQNVIGQFYGNGRAQLMMPIPDQTTGLAPRYFLVDYDPQAQTFSATDTGIAAAATEIAFAAADLDGDGRAELIDTLQQGTGIDTFNSIRARYNTSSPGTVRLSAPQPILSVPRLNINISLAGPVVADFNLDGRTDLAFSTGWSEYLQPTRTLTYRVYLSTGASNGVLSPLRETASFDYTFATLQPPPNDSMMPQFASIDWNGDNCTDLLFGDTIRLGRCDGSFGTTVTLPPSAAIRWHTPFTIADYDGDGRQDIVFVPMTYSFASGFPFLVWTTSTVQVMRAGATAPESTPMTATPSEGASLFLSAIDHDADGKADIALVGPDSADLLVHRHAAPNTPAGDVLLSLTDGFGATTQFTYSSLVASGHTRGLTAMYPEADVQPALMVAKALTLPDGNEGTYTLSFGYFGARSHLAGRGFEGFFSKVTFDSREPELRTYENFGQGFPLTGWLTRRTQLRTLIKKAGLFQLPLPVPTVVRAWEASPSARSLGGSANEVRTFVANATETLTEYETQVLSADTTKNGVQVRREVKSFQYDDFGNPTRVATTVTDLDTQAPASPTAGQTWESVVTTTYDTDTSSWCLGLPNFITITSTVPGQPSMTKTQQLTNDLGFCRVSTSRAEPASPTLSSLTSTTYDACGGVRTEAVTGRNPDGTDMAERLTTTTWSPSCRFAQTVTNAENETSSMITSETLGVPLSKTDSNGSRTTLSYDGFGRLTREDRPDGTSRRLTYESWSAANVHGPSVRVRVVETIMGGSGQVVEQREQLFDGLDRLVQERHRNLSGTTTIDRELSYDQKGRIVRDLLPYPLGGQHNGYRQTQYDVFDRVYRRALVKPDGALDRELRTTSLGATTITRDTRGQVTETVRDATGLLRRVTEPSPGGVTSYDYDAFNGLVRINGPTRIVSTFTNDVLGRRVRASAANAPPTLSTYDSLGQLVRRQTQLADLNGDGVVNTIDLALVRGLFGTANPRGDANGDGVVNSLDLALVRAQFGSTVTSATFAYDKLGRLRTRTEREGTSTWTYGASPLAGNVGRLIGIVGPGYEETRSYDRLGRVANRSIRVGQSGWYAFDSTYNADGLLDTLAYPSAAPRFTVKHSYTNGQLTGVADITTGTPRALWALEAENDSRLPLRRVFGGGLSAPMVATNSYEPWSNDPLSIQAGVQGSMTNRMNLALSWDRAHNLETRRDVNRGLTEGFVVDELNRLTSSTLNGVTTLTMSYDAAGRVTSKSDVGAYAYDDPAHPHAVTTAGSSTFTYDVNGNCTSRNGAAQSWLSFALPSTLRSGTASSTFAYSPDRALVQEETRTASGTETTQLVGDGLTERVLARDGSQLFRYKVRPPGGGEIVVERSPSGTSTMSVLTDHLGSSQAMVSNDTGAMLAEASFAPFGQRRSANTLSTLSAAEQQSFAALTHTGFGGHRQLDAIDLVHMGGRVYDPVVARFLSVDPLSNLEKPQTLDSYNYVSNRPLSAVDPTGFYGVEGEDLVQDTLPIDLSSFVVTVVPQVVTVTGRRADLLSTGPARESSGTTDLNLTALQRFQTAPESFGLAGAWLAGWMAASQGQGSTASVLDTKPNEVAFRKGYQFGKTGLWELVAPGSGTFKGLAVGFKAAMLLPFRVVDRSVQIPGLLDLTFKNESRTLWFTARAEVQGDTLAVRGGGLFDSNSLRTDKLGDMLAVKNELCQIACEAGFKKVDVLYDRVGEVMGGTTAHPDAAFRWLFDAETGRKLSYERLR